MSTWVGVEMSDHLSSLKATSKRLKKDARAKAQKRRRTARASRNRNRR